MLQKKVIPSIIHSTLRIQNQLTVWSLFSLQRSMAVGVMRSLHPEPEHTLNPVCLLPGVHWPMATGLVSRLPTGLTEPLPAIKQDWVSNEELHPTVACEDGLSEERDYAWGVLHWGARVEKTWLELSGLEEHIWVPLWLTQPDLALNMSELGLSPPCSLSKHSKGWAHPWL